MAENGNNSDSAIANIGFKCDRAKARDTLGRVYEYFLAEFTQAEGEQLMGVVRARLGGLSYDV